MAVALEPLVKPRVSTGGGGGGYLRRYGGRGGGGGDEGSNRQFRRELGPAGIWVAIVAIVTFFASFCGAYILRRAIGVDWKPLELPSILWFNTALLIASSFAVEQARALLRRGLVRPFRRWWSLATGLGAAFLFGQWLAWMELARSGIYLVSNPSGSFFYLLTATHAVHLLGGEVALVYVGARASRRPSASPLESVNSARIYWHFLAVLWVFLFAMLRIWR